MASLFEAILHNSGGILHDNFWLHSTWIYYFHELIHGFQTPHVVGQFLCSVVWGEQRVSLVEQELPTLPEHLSSPLVFSGVPVTRSLVLYVCIVDRCLSFCTFSFGHCVVCSSIYGFWLPPFGIFKLFL